MASFSLMIIVILFKLKLELYRTVLAMLCINQHQLHGWMLFVWYIFQISIWRCLRISNLELCATCWAHFMCHHEMWLTSMSHPYSSLSSSLAFAGGITIPIFRLVLQKFAIPGCFHYIIFITFFSPYFLLVGLLLQSVPVVSVQGTS